ncbi:FAD-binding protein [Micromonospora phytophila]|uniref:FAD-binding oxidoreductase n=1 Tax=Micromonospora phytophila TaxID=709888 RepID=UPI0020301633|nr:FAD-linked oxidase C-terminal domain-containing protein [Micromonospora phytophila]MCM0673468.1 FAD-binding protein [Micromonospora phytophila]
MTSALPSPTVRNDLGEAGPALTAHFADRFCTDPDVVVGHVAAQGWLRPQAPQAVLYAESAADVREAVRIASRHQVPLLPYGGGTSLEGQTNAPFGGVCLDLSRMNAVLNVSRDDLTVTVQPGVRREDLNDALRAQGLFFPVDPGANATLGGMAGTRASGTRAVGYGTMRDNVIAAEVVLASGEQIRVGSRAAKSASGYDLLRLFVGSEGTLGVFVELTLRVQPIAERVQTGSARFASVGDAVAAMIAARRAGLFLSRVELLDPTSIRATNQYSGLDLPDTPHLFFELSGSAPRVAAELPVLGAILADHRAAGVELAEDADDGRRLWRSRHDLWWATHALFPGRTGLPTDVCVPLTALAGCIEFAVAEAERAGLDAPLCGHVGDGNFHMLVMVDPDDDLSRQRATAFARTLATRAIEVGGTCSGEHGIGQGKRSLMRLEHGAGVDVMAAVKLALDPLGILNPGKII